MFLLIIYVFIKSYFANIKTRAFITAFFRRLVLIFKKIQTYQNNMFIQANNKIIIKIQIENKGGQAFKFDFKKQLFAQMV